MDRPEIPLWKDTEIPALIAKVVYLLDELGYDFDHPEVKALYEQIDEAQMAWYKPLMDWKDERNLVLDDLIARAEEALEKGKRALLANNGVIVSPEDLIKLQPTYAYGIQLGLYTYQELLFIKDKDAEI